jgi:starch synthase
LTIHNLAYQGIFSKEKMLKTGLSQDYFTISGFEFYDNINLLKGGIQYADLVNTVSPTYADEVQTPEYGCGLEGVLKNRRDAFCGIINGVDYKVWNPQGDFYIFKRYSKFTLDGKKNNKLMLQEACGLRKGEKKTLLGFVGRTVEQKGIDLLLKILPQLCHEGVETVILGKGDAKYEKALFEMSRENPELIFYSSRFDECLAHRIYASSDIFLMPSRFEPCGIGQLISFKYGTIPIVYRTGGFVDTVMDYSLDKKMGRGFVFNEYNEGAFWGAIQRARKVSVNRKEWQALIKRVMSLDFSWKESAKKYIKLYEAAMAL